MDQIVSAKQQTKGNDHKLIPFKVDPLTESEAKRLVELEAKISRSNADRGRALREIRDDRLYRATHPNFEAYLKQQWEMSRSRAYQLIDFANFLDLSTNVDKPKTEGESRAKTAARKKGEKVLKPKSLSEDAAKALRISPKEAKQLADDVIGEPMRWADVDIPYKTTVKTIVEDALQRRLRSLSGPDEEEEIRSFCQKKGLPYCSPFDLRISSPDFAPRWIDGFVDFLDGLNAAPLSEEDRAYVLECIGDARTFLDRYEKGLLPDEPESVELSSV